MRSSPCLAFLLFAVWSVGVEAQSGIESVSLGLLSDCVRTRCYDLVLDDYSCSAPQPCFCDNEQLQSDVSACLMSSGCTAADRLSATRLHANTCERPVRDRGSMLSIVTYVFFGVAVIFTFARLLARWPRLQGAGYGWDDYVAVLCLGPLVAILVGNHFAVRYGLGRDVWALDAESVKNVAMWVYILQTQYTFVVFSTKISLVSFYLRTWHARDTLRSLCWITFVLLGASLIAFEVVVIIQCLPIDSIWTRYVDPSSQGQCIDRQSWLWALAGVNVAFVCWTILLPIPKLVTLKLSWSRKLGACTVFLVGSAVTAMAVVRMFYIQEFVSGNNITYAAGRIGLYSTIEAFLSQICCCMPAIAGLFGRSWRGELSKSGSKTPLVPEEHSPHWGASMEPTVNSPAIFGPSMQDPEKTAKPSEGEDSKGSREYSSSHDSAPSPIIQRGSRASQQLRPQPSLGAVPWNTSKHTANRDTIATANTEVTHKTSTSTTNSSTWRTPDILYHDKQNQLRLEIHDPPRQPVKATLTYLDRFDAKHDVELQGRPQTADRIPSDDSSMSSTTRPSTSPSPNRESGATGPGDYVSFVGRGRQNVMKVRDSQTRIDQLLKAHKALTEGSSVSDVRASLGKDVGDRTSKAIDV